MNWLLIGNIVGLLLMLNGGFMLLVVPYGLYTSEPEWISFLIASLGSFGVGAVMTYMTVKRNVREFGHREGFLIVALGWMVMILSGSLPHVLSGAFSGFTNAFFETVSGYTTTGASVLNDIEIMPKSILLWRSITQWIGGMGIIVLTVAILPFLGIGGMQLFGAEAPGISADKLHPRITETAKRLWAAYVSLTVACACIYWFGGMNLFDAINHALATLSTGGYSTKNASLANENALVQYNAILFMFIGGVNFTLIYSLFRGNWKRPFRNEEFRYYCLALISLCLLVIGLNAYEQGVFSERSARDVLFQVVSVISTCGFVSFDYTIWSPLAAICFFFMMFLGGSAGSTSGGIKIVRHIVLVKNSFLEFRRLLHPNALIPVRINRKAIDSDITSRILAFFILYLMSFVVGVVLLLGFGNDLVTSFGAAASAIGNVGPGFGEVGPVSNYASLNDASKWLLCWMMLVGRLELFTVLLLLSPHFWSSN